MIDIEKFICSLLNRASGLSVIKVVDIINALHNQGLDYQNGKIVSIEDKSELKKSEDEKIRKTLIHIVKGACDKYGIKYQGKEISEEKLLAWLEKQGEHANFRNKIQIGDKVTRNKDGMLVNLSQLDRVAKKGEKQGEQNLLDNVTKQVTKDKETAISFSRSTGIINENGELAEPYRVCESTSNWSEEDERIYNRICDIVHNAAFTNYDVDEDGNECGEYAKIIGWFKDLKDRYTWKPSEEQMASIGCAVRNMKESACYDSDLVSLFNDLKKLREE